MIIFLIYKSIKTYVKYRRNVKKEDRLIEEIENLNGEILKLKKQNEKFSEITDEHGNVEYDEEGNIKNELKEGESRFFKLSNVDAKFKSTTQKKFIMIIN